MLTYSKNRKGFAVLLLVFLGTALMTLLATIMASLSSLGWQWYISLPLIMAVLFFMHLMVLLFGKGIFMRLSRIHSGMFLAYLTAEVIATGFLLFNIYLLYSDTEPKEHEKITWKVVLMVICIMFQWPARLLVLASLLGRDNQMVQAHLHPYLEIDDSVTEKQRKKAASMTVQMQDIQNTTTTTTRDNTAEPSATSVSQKMIIKDWPIPQPFPVQALYSFDASSTSELSFRKGDVLKVIDCSGKWWNAENPQTGTTGYIPSNYINIMAKARVIQDYSADPDNIKDEASIVTGQVVEVIESHDDATLIKTVHGKIGSVPTECLEMINK